MALRMDLTHGFDDSGQRLFTEAGMQGGYYGDDLPAGTPTWKSTPTPR